MNTLLAGAFGLIGGIFSVVYYFLMVFTPKLSDSFIFGKVLPIIVPLLVSITLFKVFSMWFHSAFTWVQIVVILGVYIVGLGLAILYFRTT